ncbi:hypothetical protein J5N97_023173 [Dioscorea zingiberensis]|uniref:Uncharacterized protein n=1 Tax=Dioscorea zingiberensis TaxID=325984 RepID=A0A9D5CBI8_9LILI|nr:hypothetical protein J5N97_023173 [Dioscorea zingiberensis]
MIYWVDFEYIEDLKQRLKAIEEETDALQEMHDKPQNDSVVNNSEKDEVQTLVKLNLNLPSKDMHLETCPCMLAPPPVSMQVNTSN